MSRYCTIKLRRKYCVFFSLLRHVLCLIFPQNQLLKSRNISFHGRLLICRHHCHVAVFVVVVVTVLFLLSLLVVVLVLSLKTGTLLTNWYIV